MWKRDKTLINTNQCHAYYINIALIKCMINMMSDYICIQWHER